MNQTTQTSSANHLISDQTAENITRIEELAYEITIDEVMTHDVNTLAPTMKMRQALDLFRKMRISGAPVTSDGILAGILSIEDLIRCLCENDLDAPISKYMTTKTLTVKGSDPIVEALKMFVNSGRGRLPVINGEKRLLGILTKGDINRGLLKALTRNLQKEEMRRYRVSHLFDDIESERTSLILRYSIKPGDFNLGGSASSDIKRTLTRLGASPQIVRRCSIAVYEAEMNLVIHTFNGGTIEVEIDPDQVSIRTLDDGPGIENVTQALKPGFSTADDKIRELGFGAGMGLVNISRCTDEMILESTWGKGTDLKMKINITDKDISNDTITDNQD